jgi:hypothetical protein
MGAWVWFEMALAEIARDTGRAQEAIRRFREVADAAQGGPARRLSCGPSWGGAGAPLLGECVEAAAALKRPTGWATARWPRRWRRGADPAWLMACRGDLASARQHIRETVEPVRQDEMFIFELTLLHDLVRLGAPRGRRPARGAGRVHRRAHRRHPRGPRPGPHRPRRRRARRRGPLRGHRLAVPGGRGRRRAGRRPPGAGRVPPGDGGPAALGGAGQPGRRPAHAGPRPRRGIEPLTAREREVALLAVGGAAAGPSATTRPVDATVDTHLARSTASWGSPAAPSWPPPSTCEPRRAA